VLGTSGAVEPMTREALLSPPAYGGALRPALDSCVSLSRKASRGPRPLLRIRCCRVGVQIAGTPANRDAARIQGIPERPYMRRQFHDGSPQPDVLHFEK
jgi:hypothetical protein